MRPQQPASCQAERLPRLALGAFESECVEFFAELVQALGVPKSVGQIYGLLFASPVPLTFTDIVRTLSISKGSASQGLRTLRSLGAVRPVRVLRQQQEHFGPELGLRRLVAGLLRRKVAPLAHGNKRRLERMRRGARLGANSADSDFLLGRVQQIETWRRQLRIMLPVLRTFLDPA